MVINNQMGFPFFPLYRRRRAPGEPLQPQLERQPPLVALPDAKWRQSIIALMWFFVWTSGLSHVLGVPFVWLFLAFLAIALLLGAMALMLLARWARRDDGRLGQFSIATGLFLILVLATIFGFSHWASEQAILGFSRWVTDQPMALQTGYERAGPRSYGSWIAISTLMVLTSIPFTVLLVDSALWGSIWLLRRVRRRTVPPGNHVAQISSPTEQATSIADKNTQ